MENAHPAESISQHRRRRRWLIRLGLLLVLIITISIFAIMLILQPSGLTISQAQALADQIFSPGEHTRFEYEQLLGSPHSVRDVQNGLEVVWNFLEHSWNEVRNFGYVARLFPDGVMMDVKMYDSGTVDWRSAWRYRWILLKHRLGITQSVPFSVR